MLENNENNGENVAPTEEELKQESEATQEVSVEDVRADVIEKYGLNEDDNSELIDQLTEDGVSTKKNLSKAIGQKIGFRTKLEEAGKGGKEDDKEKEKAEKAKKEKEAEDAGVEGAVTKALEKRDLDALEYSDEVKAQIKKIAEVNNTSILEALKDPYIVSVIETAATADKNVKAAVKGSNKGTTVKFNVDKPPKVDMSTEEGRKTWGEYKAYLTEEEAK